MTAADYNARQLTAGAFKVADLPPVLVAAFKRGWTAFVAAVEAWQGEHGLTPDGMCGPKTLQAIRASVPAPLPGLVPIFGMFERIPGVVSVTYRPGVLAGRPRKPGVLVNSIVLHQSVSGDGNNNGHATDELERILSSRGLGVDMAIDGDGSLTVYRDIGMECSAHGNERNSTSVGIEVLNPYTRLDPPLWTTMVDPSPTAWKGREVADTDAQIATLAAVIRWLTSRTWDGPDGRKVAIPLAWPTTPADKPAKTSPLWYDLATGGILAHGHRPAKTPAGKTVDAHSDGRRTAWAVRRLIEGA